MKSKTWKCAVAFAIALTLVVGTMPANIDSLLTGGTVIVTQAANLSGTYTFAYNNASSENSPIKVNDIISSEITIVLDTMEIGNAMNPFFTVSFITYNGSQTPPIVATNWIGAFVIDDQLKISAASINSALGGTESATQYVVTNVDFTATGDNRKYTITVEPVSEVAPATAPTISTVLGSNLTYGYDSGSVVVSASAATGHNLSYQWYSNTTNSNY
jgi:hypothetical protein